MTESGLPPSLDRLRALPDEAATGVLRESLTAAETAGAETRKRVLRAVRSVAEERPSAFEGLTPSVAPFLTDEERAVRLTAAKLFAALAETAPAAVLPAVESLADRLADDTEFYYVRARAAEALGYVALEHPEPIGDPEILADLRIGLAFDEPEVRTQLAKALEHVALGDPSRLRHHVDALAEQLPDDDALVRYHLCTALVAVACESPERLTGAEAPLRELLDDASPYVRGRAAEALGLLARAAPTGRAIQELETPDADAPTFLTSRLRFANAALAGDAEELPDGIGTVDAVRGSTETAVTALTSPDGPPCPNCGLVLPDAGPPTCPRCGVPR